MTRPSPRPRNREHIPAATQAALWALSNGRCYAPGCPQPVVVEVRVGIYKKNAQISHIYGVEPKAPRYVPPERMSPHIRDSFKHLLLLCLPHHGEVDDKATGEKLYPASILLQWKARHEGADGPALAALGALDEEQLSELLENAFTPPLQRLEEITQRLARTGEVTQQTVRDLKQVIRVLGANESGVSADTARKMAFAAESLGNSHFTSTASKLAYAAEILPKVASQMASTLQQYRGMM